jgi:CheY-like chemotaxis protein
MATQKISTLMIVDDDDVDQMMCKRILGRSGLVDTVLGYLYAEEALDHLKGNQIPSPDILLLDINMPRMTGFEFLEEMSQLPDDVQKPMVVMLTSSGNPSDKLRASEFKSVKGYLTKPLSEESLRRIIQPE